jgi:AraC-like DNA-binding protein
VRAWRAQVPGIIEVLHARFVEHIYPAHVHDAWTLLIVDDGVVRYDLDRFEHGALRSRVTLLPPHVPHTGRAHTADGFRKRVLYLDANVLGHDLAGRAVDNPSLPDPVLRRRISQLHDVLVAHEDFEAESRLALIRARLYEHLRPADPQASSAELVARHPVATRRLAARLRELIDARIATGITLREASRILHAHPDHLVRAFKATFGLPPHRYLTSRRIDIARRLLLAGQPPAEVAGAVGFHDQAHLTRHFTRQLGTTPARYARSAG